MPIELIDIAVAERHAHPSLSDRITGKVRAVLSETIGGRDQQHEILVPVWTDRNAAMTDEDVDLALLVKAADIVGRLKQRLAPPQDEA
ncbi:hypothetical protein [Devosia sp. 63-57]|uniref:hypothetical protein n=1 Tax=Devosia sp. 63-57 TaxID=1895751 RepID=UPI00086E4194|nr:hypothetical protein [Devosia sp. 63-57]ODT48840.1 MAG: hypothetical protein ABS74_10040 [Pelagibacterium sp. SCN 63-126]ODU86871.1 MAG: hypothetical protein ABT14_07085 [Pelagibacterium sp. SCN 63-17]OJX44232.1 MAG: hypothetical protein BGO80_01170 [Devosia sp. 63-57]